MQNMRNICITTDFGQLEANFFQKLIVVQSSKSRRALQGVSTPDLAEKLDAVENYFALRIKTQS